MLERITKAFEPPLRSVIESYKNAFEEQLRDELRKIAIETADRIANQIITNTSIEISDGGDALAIVVKVEKEAV